MTLAFWTTLAALALITTLLLRLTVRFLARGADNGWDNAFGYVVVSGLLTVLPAKWLWEGGHPFILFLVAPFLIWMAQVVTLKIFYEITYSRAFVVGVAHTVLSSIVIGTLTLGAAIVAAYIVYGRIIADPMILIRIILRLIGLPIPLGWD